MGNDDSKEEQEKKQKELLEKQNQLPADGGFAKTSFTKESAPITPAETPSGDGFVKQSMGKPPPKLINKPLPEAEKAKPKKARAAISPLLAALNKIKEAEEEKKRT